MLVIVTAKDLRRGVFDEEDVSLEDLRDVELAREADTILFYDSWNGLHVLKDRTGQEEGRKSWGLEDGRLRALLGGDE